MTQNYFLGVDVDATKSHALIADAQGQAVGFAVGGSGNHEDVGYEGSIRTLQQIVRGALK